jgi:predicted metal-dependent peptidase
MINKAESLAKASKNLMLSEPFYGMFLIMLNKIWDKNVPTAGVSRNGINYQLSINEEFWNKLTELNHQGLLKHELLHIGFFHLTDFDFLTNKEIANIAMDLEINQYIDKEMLPEGGMTLSLFPELKLETKKGTEYYYEKLLKASNKKGKCPNLDKMLEGMGQGEYSIQVTIGKGNKEQDVNLPSHDWGEFEKLDEATKKLINTQTAHILKEIAEQVEKSRGTIPGEFAEILEKLNQIEESKFNWKAFLRRFAGGSTKVFTKRTRRKENIRFEDAAGLKVKPKRRILVGVDTSGSVSTKELKEFMNELHHINKTGTEITVIQCDTAISHIGKFNVNADMNIHGRGGTSFEPVCDYYNEHSKEYSCLVYFTDGEASAPDKCKGPVLWAISTNGTMNEELQGIKIQLN